MSQERVMLLIDADNVSIDVVEQAVALLLQEHGAVHVRRAYCTAEAALKHQALFRRLGIKPMVNLVVGKNCTDIALAVDAIDLVLAERPDVVAIASSDSDFAPLVSRLREKGCRVVGLGQVGKTGDETRQAYDSFTVLEHHKPRATAKTRPAAKRAAAKLPSAAAAPVAKRAPRAKPAASAPAPAVQPAPPDKLRQILDCLPELARGERVELRVVSARLRDAKLLSKNASSTKLLGLFAERFEMLPPGQPNHVRLRL
jgi:uncharacterized protein (TIGR00288 family)